MLIVLHLKRGGPSFLGAVFRHGSDEGDKSELLWANSIQESPLAAFSSDGPVKVWQVPAWGPIPRTNLVLVYNERLHTYSTR
jgi:hypothetical protein